MLDPFYLAGAHVAFREPGAFEQLFQVFARRPACYLHFIGLVDAKARVHQPMSEVAVVGQQQ